MTAARRVRAHLAVERAGLKGLSDNQKSATNCRRAADGKQSAGDLRLL